MMGTFSTTPYTTTKLSLSLDFFLMKTPLPL